MQKFPATILRLFQVYGSKQDSNRVLPHIIKGCLNNKKFPVSRGDQIRDFCYIDDVVNAIFLALASKKSNGEIFNIGADKHWSIKEIAILVADIARKHGIEANIEHKEARHEVKHAFCDHSKAKELLDFKDDTDIIVLIEKVFEWAKAQPDRKVKLMDYEVEKGIYSFWKT